MRIVTIATVAGVVAALIAMAPAVASSIQPPVEQTRAIVRIDTGWRAKSGEPGCVLKRVWKVDYSGNPYLKKVRVCA